MKAILSTVKLVMPEGCTDKAAKQLQKALDDLQKAGVILDWGFTPHTTGKRFPHLVEIPDEYLEWKLEANDGQTNWNELSEDAQGDAGEALEVYEALFDKL